MKKLILNEFYNETDVNIHIKLNDNISDKDDILNMLNNMDSNSKRI